MPVTGYPSISGGISKLPDSVPLTPVIVASFPETVYWKKLASTFHWAVSIAPPNGIVFGYAGDHPANV